MKTRNSGTPKSVPTPSAKKTPPLKKTPPPPKSKPTTDVVTPPSSSTATDVTTPKTSSPIVSKQQKSGGAATPKPTTPKLVAKAKAKKIPAGRAIKPITKAAAAKAAAAAAAAETPELAKKGVERPDLNEESIVENVAVEGIINKEESVVDNVNQCLKEEEVVGSIGESDRNVDKSLKEKESVVADVEKSPKKIESVVESPKKVDSEVVAVKDGGEDEQLDTVDDEEETVDATMEAEGNPNNMEEVVEEDAKGKGVQLDEEEHDLDETIVDYGEHEGFEEPRDEEGAEDNGPEPEEEAKQLEADHREMSALANDRKTKKEREIFVGGLDRDTVEEDIKKAFTNIGEIIEVRLHKNPSTNKSKGYAFVKFANKEQANKALSELKNPLIRGKRCGVAPSEDNDTLFVGNICNTWTKEAIKKKLKEYGLEGVENITLVSDAQHEGLSRGFAFVEFSCHADAMLAYKRLQKPDVVFGHAERTVKVAFAEPLREPDPEIMAQVKSVFIDGLPSYWDEERVRKHFTPFGTIERIVLARNMPSAKRKDFGFVDFNTHEAAIACIDGVNNTELGDEKSKLKVKVRLSNPQPKIQAVKGGLCGGFLIGRPGSGFSRFGRGLGQGGRPFGNANFQRGKDYHPRARGRTGRYDFAGEDIVGGPYSRIRGRHPVGGRGGFGGGGRRGYDEEVLPQTATSSRLDLGRSRYGVMERGHGTSTLARRQPFSPEERFSRPVGGRHYVDDPYLYDEGSYGLKRPYSMLDHEPGYLEPNRLRLRFDRPDPIVSSRQTQYRDSFGEGSGLYAPDYYHSMYGDGGYSSMYGDDRSYGGGYYY
ncbi:Polyadenylate-binding protein, cytoplasmic and nuclear [Thalictrum thalictroides]|uniref:Polyadenylate-binding protein, cytoplasmic and nuclear n=1 Tax=Thalictrum thalictroides TaxID=46969 RepID=A0A7J6VZ53_THATH|nr:Polyadenylate-binding protein, cytoplasmic and nuclear [Thalictrum thalictroides]